MLLLFGYLSNPKCQYHSGDLELLVVCFGLWGKNGQFRAMQYMGVSVGNPLSSGAQLVFGSLIGAIVFGEWSKPVQYTLGIIALLLLVIGFYFTSRQDAEKVETSELTDFGKGFRALTYSTVGYLSYTILFNNIMKFDALAVIFPMAVGMVIGAMMFMKFKRLKFETVVIKKCYRWFDVGCW